MTVLRFFLKLFLFICLLAGSSVLVAALCLMARFPLLLITVAFTCLLFWRLISSKSIRAFCDINRQRGIKT
ncbi:hypothetical protein [Pseudomonas sp. GL-B-19]|uniref:hypothetical protein n=1 Tax=Pseudomonas sp. GL-B-19 TaxID=2832393 RepID=UPI001CBD8349|nr:hypothetical protein [Pseudomonas sp. GL-B-19]